MALHIKKMGSGGIGNSSTSALQVCPSAGLMPHAMCAQVEEAAASSQRQLASHIEELQRQLEGASHEVDEWRAQASQASEHAQQLEQQLPELTSRAARAEVRQM